MTPVAGGAAQPPLALSIAPRSSLVIFSMASIARQRPLGIGVGKGGREALWYHLPAQPVAVLQPAAGDPLPAFGQGRPVVVDFLGRATADYERDRLVEGEVLRAAVEGDEGWPSSSKRTVITEPAGPGRASP